MMTASEFSVVIPVFNRAVKLERSIASVRRARQPAGARIEIVVVDDGSRDGSAEVARRMGADQVLVCERNVGVT